MAKLIEALANKEYREALISAAVWGNEDQPIIQDRATIEIKMQSLLEKIAALQQYELDKDENEKEDKTKKVQEVETVQGDKPETSRASKPTKPCRTQIP